MKCSFQPFDGVPQSMPIYKIFTAAGVYLGLTLAFLLAQRNGLDPLRLTLALCGCVLAGFVGARLHHLIIFQRHYRGCEGARGRWNRAGGGAGLFGGLILVTLVTPLFAAIAGTGLAVFWDYLTIAMIVGAIFTRLGCFFNGCCAGRETLSPLFGFIWHNHRGERKRRVPVQLLEVCWLAICATAAAYYFPRRSHDGLLAALAVGWYALGRFWLEPLREEPDLIGRVRINQIFAAVVLLGSGVIALLEARQFR